MPWLRIVAVVGAFYLAAGILLLAKPLMAAFFYFVKWSEPGQPPRGSQTFLSLKAVRSYARRVLYAHPTWVA